MTALIYYRIDGQLQSKRVDLAATTKKAAVQEARKIAAEYNGRLVSID